MPNKQCWNWPKRTGGSAAEMFEILPRNWILWPIFTQKWASVDMNPPSPTIPTLHYSLSTAKRWCTADFGAACSYVLNSPALDTWEKCIVTSGQLVIVSFTTSATDWFDTAASTATPSAVVYKWRWMFWRFQGATENVGVENAARAKMQGWKMQEWKMRE